MNMYLNIDYESNFEKLEIDVLLKSSLENMIFQFLKNEVAKYFEEFNDVEIIEFEEAGHYPMIESPVLLLQN